MERSEGYKKATLWWRLSAGFAIYFLVMGEVGYLVEIIIQSPFPSRNLYEYFERMMTVDNVRKDISLMPGIKHYIFRNYLGDPESCLDSRVPKFRSFSNFVLPVSSCWINIHNCSFTRKLIRTVRDG